MKKKKVITKLQKLNDNTNPYCSNVAILDKNLIAFASGTSDVTIIQFLEDGSLKIKESISAVAFRALTSGFFNNSMYGFENNSMITLLKFNGFENVNAVTKTMISNDRSYTALGQNMTKDILYLYDESNRKLYALDLLKNEKTEVGSGIGGGYENAQDHRIWEFENKIYIILSSKMYRYDILEHTITEILNINEKIKDYHTCYFDNGKFVFILRKNTDDFFKIEWDAEKNIFSEEEQILKEYKHLGYLQKYFKSGKFEIGQFSGTNYLILVNFTEGLI